MEAPVQQIKGYDLRERIGAGGFGAVYKAYQSTVGREVAIKVILPGLSNQPDFIRRFESEAQLVARLEHPHITPLYDYWRDPQGAYLVMRWLRGGSLRDALANGPFELRSAALLLDQIAAALSLAHRSGVIHRDIKPGNILLDEDGNAYLTDFGIAKDLNLPDNHTQQDVIVGSLDYISPEQARSEPVTARTDIYSLGVTLYEMITGHHPFEGISAIERLYKHINDPLPQIDKLEPQLQTAINRVIQKATAKNPDHRYPDALALAADFREAIGLNRSPTSVEELLTQREHEILQMIIDGMANKEIAQRLTVTLGTVKWHVNQIYGKLGVRSRVQAIVRARELNLIVRPGESINAVPIPTEDFYPHNPYKGLLAFQSADHQDFYGREKVTARLIRRMAESGEYRRFLAVVGPSGSGKSSLVKAGLVPSLWRGDLPGSEKWFVVEMMPGTHPFDELEVALTRVASQQISSLQEHLRRDNRGLVRAAGLVLPQDNSELVLVIDQFEEIFTLTADETERSQFLDLLYQSIIEPRSRVRVIITLRADFYDRPLHYPQFGELVHSRLETIMPLSTEELERAISQPAEQVGVAFEPGLVTTIIGDVNYQPGALPLLQYALTELFELRRGRVLTREAYQSIGGTVGALAKRAEDIYRDLNPQGQEFTRQIFLRLVTLGEGVEDTRRRTARSELQALSEDTDTLEEVIDTFAAYRLLSLDTDPGTRSPTIEVAHEALVREWERLRLWLNESRDEIRLQRQLSTMAQEWKAAGKDASDLVRGARLQTFAQWAEVTGLTLTSLEHEFLDSSQRHWELEQAQEAERRLHEQRLERRSQTFLRGLVAVLLFATIGAIALSSAALNNAREAETERDNTQRALATSDANFARAEQQRLYLAADNAMDDKAVGNIGMALAIRSLAYGYTSGADAALMRASRQGMILRNFEGHQFEIYTVTFSPDGTRLATSTEGGTRIYDTQTGTELLMIAQTGIVYDVVFSPDGKQLLSVGTAEDPTLWDVESGQPVRVYPTGEEALYVQLAPDGTSFATRLRDRYELWNIEEASNPTLYFLSRMDANPVVSAIYDGDSVFWLVVNDAADNHTYLENAETGEVGCTLVEAGLPPLNSIFSFDQYGIVLVTDEANIARTWDIRTCTILATFSDQTSTIIAADYDPNRDVMITGDDSGSAFEWGARTGIQLNYYTTTSRVLSLDISPDGQLLLMMQWNIASIWDLGFPSEPRQIVTDQYDKAYFPRFSPDGQIVYIGGFGRYSRWDLNAPDVPLITYDQPIRVLDIAPDGKTLFVAYEDSVADPDYNGYLIDAESGDVLQQYIGHTQGINFMDFSDDGRRVATGSFDLTARIWDVATGETLHILEGHTGVVSSASFSPDGKLLLTTSSDNTVRLWDTVTGEVVRVIETGVPIPYGQFSPDSKLITLADTNGFGHLIDVATGETLHLLVGHTDVIWTARFSPDGTRVVTASWDGTARIWDVATGQTLRVLDNSAATGLYWAEFSPDGNFVMTGAELDNQVYIWRTELDDVIHSFCARSPLDLTPQQRAQYGISDNDPVCTSGTGQNVG